MKLLCAITLLILLAGCGADDDKDPGVPWRTSEIVGYRYTLVDSDNVQEYAFHASGSVAATVGSKNAVAAPLLYWHIDERGVLNIGERPGKSQIRLIKLESDDTRVVVKSPRKPMVYTKIKTTP